MPELPEVETVCRGLIPVIVGCTIKATTVRCGNLRWPVTFGFDQKVVGSVIQAVTRRAKYILITLNSGTIIIHLGMSGHLVIVARTRVPEKHDHVDMILSNNTILRFNDSRRFGAVLWTDQPIDQHPRLQQLGPEPLSKQFNLIWLKRQIIRRSCPIKHLITNNSVVVGVGNIYASEALFRAGILPMTPCNLLSHSQLQSLIKTIVIVLKEAIEQGGTTLKDFVNSKGLPGYFAQSLWVYGREKQKCFACCHLIERIKMQGRSTYFCPVCQS